MMPQKDAKPRLFYTFGGLSFMRDRLSSAEVSKQVLAANVRRLREARGLNQDELGEKVGLSRSGIGQIERAEVDTAFSTAVAIAEELGVSISVLAGERTEREELSSDALKIAQRFDQLDLEDQVVIKRVFWKFGGTPPSKQ